MKYQPILGLEIHAQLLTRSKIFCSCSTDYGDEPNKNTCPVCLGHPGALPVLNKISVEYAMLIGAAVNCKINSNSSFARKNYFYPDLPKGYQITQYKNPVCENGYLNISGNKIRIRRIHLEEDAGKSIHSENETFIDFNRSGIPLVEIVTEPDIKSGIEASLFMKMIRQILRYLKISSGNLEEGSLRCDANISLKKKEGNIFGNKVEIKNINSFKNIEKAIDYEINRQTKLIDNNENIQQQTFRWNDVENKSELIRTKEEENDYRYFPEPDLQPVFIDSNWKSSVINSLPELPDDKMNRYINDLKLPKYDSEILTEDKNIAEYFEKVIEHTDDYKSASNWMMGNVLKTLNEKNINIKELNIKPEYISKIIKLVNNDKLNNNTAKEIFEIILRENKSPEVIIEERNLLQITDVETIEKFVDEILDSNSSEVEKYLNGKDGIFGYLIGRIMKQSGGKANPVSVNQILKKKLNELKNKGE